MQFLVIISLMFVAVKASTYWPWDPRSPRNQGRGNSFDVRNFRDPNSSASGSSNSNNPALAKVNEIKELLLNVEKKLNSFCEEYTDQRLSEEYGGNYYTLSADMKGCPEEAITVKAGQRLVSVQAKHPRCKSIAVHVLPVSVDSDSAFWRINNGILYINFPFDPDYRRCGRVITKKVQSLPKIDALYPSN